MLLAPDVHWIPGVQANVYLLVEEARCTLIDTGKESIDRVDLILNYLHKLHFYPVALQQILLTCAHADQAGNVAALQELCGAVVYGSTAVCQALITQRIEDGSLPQEPPQRWDWRSGRLVSSTAVGKHKHHEESARLKTIKAGDVLPICGGLLVLDAAQQQSDQLAFYLPRSGVLFAGEALWSKGVQARHLLRFSPAVVATSQGQPSNPHTLHDVLAIQ